MTRTSPAATAPAMAALAGYVLIRGCDATVLKWLQARDALTLARTGGAEDPIGFSNVFFYASLASGLVLLLLDRRNLRQQWPCLCAADRGLLLARTVLGLLLGPIATFQALQTLSVISQTLLFTLILPVTALLARGLLAEPLPPRFGVTLVLLPAGLLISRSMDLPLAAAGGLGLDLQGVGWGLVAVAAFAGAGVLNRLVAGRGWGVGLTLGLANLVAALVFGLLTLVLFGPEQFLHLRWWWLMGVLLVYAGGISVGGELALLASYRGLGAITVALWGNAVVLVALASAHVLLGEPLGPNTVVAAGLILAALLAAGRTEG